jgi:hypothetical protein
MFTTLKLIVVIFAVAQSQVLPGHKSADHAVKDPAKLAAWHAAHDTKPTHAAAAGVVLHADGVVAEAAVKHDKVTAKTTSAEKNAVANVEGGKVQTTAASKSPLDGIAPVTLGVVGCAGIIVLAIVGSIVSGNASRGPRSSTAAGTSFPASVNVELPTVLPMTKEDMGSML